MSLEKLKLSKSLISAMTEAGYISAKEVQIKTLSRIIGGQKLIVSGPEGCGKTTAYVLGVLMKHKYSTDEAPKVLILVPGEEKVKEVIAQFKMLSGNRSLRIIGLYGTGGMDDSIMELSEGVDIVVATPPRARAIYLKLGLNLNRLQMLIVDDAETIIRQGMQLPVYELSRSADKAQFLVFTTVIHDKLQQMVGDFMDPSVTIEIDDLEKEKVATHELVVYQVPNFRTKINLLNVLLRDKETFEKVIVFVNSRLTAQKLSKNLVSGSPVEVSVLNPLFFDEAGFDHIEDFIENEDARILIVANEGLGSLNLKGIPFIFHFELPEKPETFLQRVVKSDDRDVVGITFATDIELADLRKIEHSLGFKIPVMDMPDDVIMEGVDKSVKRKVRLEADEDSPKGGGAYHDKKESNSKTHNYGIGQKAKMNMKKKHG